MAWLFDTNVVSELRRRDADPQVMAWVLHQDPLVAYLSAVTVFELERGTRRKERTDPVQGAALRRWLDRLVREDFAGRVLPIDAEVAAIAAGMQVPDPRPEHDAFIAATALYHGLTVVTRNVKDFLPLGARVLDPWTAG